MSNPLTSPAWKRLQALQTQIADHSLKHLFDHDPERFHRFSLRSGDLFLDYSKNFINDNILDALIELAQSQHLEGRVRLLARGQSMGPGVNPVPYMSLRDRSFLPLCIDGHDISSEIRNALFSMRRLCEDIRSWHWRGYNGKPITDVITLGVGGAGNAAEMVCRALMPYHATSLKSHFFANAEPQAFKDKLNQLHPDTSLFIISSKSLATHETMQNALMAKQWLLASAGHQDAIQQHFIAITGNHEEAQRFGLPCDNILPLWDWLPGRHGLWTTAGLPIALAIGMDRFEQLLDGAHLMDQHFVNTPLAQNMPVILALLGIWYANFWQLGSRAILPYSELLEFLPGYLQHDLMEAGGKSVDLQGKPVGYATCPVIWGSAGTKNQHTYFQLLHQGTHIVPTEFIVVASDNHRNQESTSAFYHFLAQSETLMRGSPSESIDDKECVLPGNRPSTSLLLTDLSPCTLGQLLALYEHVGLTQSVIWNINPFSHWGTELGKRYSTAFNSASPEQIARGEHDSSTLGLLEVFNTMRRSPNTATGNPLPQEESAYSVF